MRPNWSTLASLSQGKKELFFFFFVFFLFFFGLCTVCHGLFAIRLGVVSRLCSVILALFLNIFCTIFLTIVLLNPDMPFFPDSVDP